MSKTIGSLAYKVIADTDQLNKAAVLTKSQMREVHKAMADTAGPADALQKRFDALTIAYGTGNISLDKYQAAVDVLNAKHPDMIAAQAKHALAVEHARQVTERNQTAQERYAVSLQKLNELKPHLSQQAYARELERINSLLPSVVGRQARNDAQLREGIALTRSLETEEERRSRTLARLEQHLRDKTISQETYNRALARENALNRQSSPAALPRGPSGGATGMNVLNQLPGGSQVSSLMSLGPAGAAASIAVGGLAAQIAIAVKFGEGFIQTAHDIDRVADRATSLGMNFNDLTLATRAFGETTGADSGAVEASLQKMQIHLVEARDGTSDLAKSLDQLGLDPDQLARMAPVDAIKAVGAEFHKIQNPAEQIKFAMELFGKSGVQMVAALRDGGAAVDDMEKHLKRAGVTLTDVQVAGVGRMNDSLERAADYVTGFANTWTAEFAPAVSATIRLLDESGVFSIGQQAVAVFTTYPLQALQSGVNALVPGFEKMVEAEKKATAAAVEADKVLREDALLRKANAEAEKAIQQSYESQREALQKQLEEKELGKAVAIEEAAIRAGIKAEQAYELRLLQEQIDHEMEKAKAIEEAAKAAEKAAKEREDAQKKLDAEAEQEHQRSLQRAEEILKKDDKSYELRSKLAEIEQLSGKGLLSPEQAAKARDKEITDAAKAEKFQSATAPTAARGSTEEYKLIYDAQKRETDKQVLELRKHEILQKQMVEKLNENNKLLEHMQIEVYTA